MKVKKKFIYDNVELIIVETEEPYLNSNEPVKMTKIIAPNGGSIPYIIKRRETLKSIVIGVTSLLDSFKLRGCDVVAELTKPKTN